MTNKTDFIREIVMKAKYGGAYSKPKIEQAIIDWHIKNDEKIGLEDVLLAVGSDKEKWMNIDYKGDAEGGYACCEQNEIIKFNWKLGKSIDDQDEPTIDSLHTLLCR